MIPEHMMPYRLLRNIGRLISFMVACALLALAFQFAIDSIGTLFQVLGF